MKQISLILSIISLIACGFLFIQNSQLRSDLDLVQDELKSLTDSKGTAASKKSVTIATRKNAKEDGQGKSSSVGESANARAPKGRSLAGLGRAKARPVDTEEILASMQEKQELMTERIAAGVDAFAEDSGISSSDHERIKTIVLDTLAEQHVIRIELQTGERDRTEGRELLLNLRTQQEEALLEILNQSSYDELMLSMREARIPKRGDR